MKWHSVLFVAAWFGEIRRLEDRSRWTVTDDGREKMKLIWGIHSMPHPLS